jgi:hypothetical protein
MKEREKMKSGHLKNALLGMVLAVIAAYLYIFAAAFFFAGPRAFRLLLSGITFMGIFYTSWVLLPLGAALGMLIPRIAYGKTRWIAALQGALLGAVSGFLAVLCLAAVYPLVGLIDSFIMSIMAYCALWVGAYAFWRAKGQSLYR